MLILEKNNMKLLNNTNEVKKILGGVFDNSETKVEASCYLLNRALITDVLVEPKFLNKVCARIADRIKDDKKGTRLRGLMKERNYCYAEMAKHNRKKKIDIDLSRVPDTIDVGSKNLYSGF